MDGRGRDGGEAGSLSCLVEVQGRDDGPGCDQNRPRTSTPSMCTNPVVHVGWGS